ncbi:putative transcriptional regulator [Lactococcus cremoris]|uniref:putative transcriptional regulator n=1 Tax=Lactococcus lactis subsp. cremoris TaxID=1359 RepID=UPI0005B46744|nr:putative transcriptional regulator [Lactococcus cremoris]
MKNQEKTINHLGQVVYQESVEFYKEKLSDCSKDFLQNSLIPQLYEWSNAYKAAIELTK